MSLMLMCTVVKMCKMCSDSWEVMANNRCLLVVKELIPLDVPHGKRLYKKTVILTHCFCSTVLTCS